MNALARGIVIRGAGLGRKLGVPTANIRVDPRQRLPKGVFKVLVSGRALGRERKAVCNVGTRPTVDRGRRRHVEVHIPRFRGDLYGKTLTVKFVLRIREERKFASLGALKAQIKRDIKEAL